MTTFFLNYLPIFFVKVIMFFLYHLWYLSIKPIPIWWISDPNFGWETFFRLCVLCFPSNYVVTHQRFIQIACQYNIWVRVCKLKKTQDVPHSVLSSSIQMALGLNLRCPWINWIAWHQTHGITLLDIIYLWMVFMD